MRIARWNWIGGLCLAASLAAAPALAQTKQQSDWCVNNGLAFSPDLQIKGCTALIQANGGKNARQMASAFKNRGDAYKDKSDYDRAIADYNEAIRLDPKFAIAFRGRALATAVLKKDYNGSIPDLTEAIRLDPKYASAYSDRCLSRAIVGQLQDALADCEEALRLGITDKADALDNRGMTYFKLGRLDDAVRDFDAALALAPKTASSLYGRGLAKIRRGDTAGGNADVAAAKAIQANITEEMTGYGIK
jgi:tetratricopeptide (TPR) repeat protein